MLKNRPIVSITIGYIFGIIMGLYCKISIVFLYAFAVIIYLILKRPKVKKFKLISYRRYFRYIKIIFTKSVVLSIAISSIISNTITIYKNKKYENLYANMQDIVAIATVASNPKEKNYYNVYKVKVENINNNYKYKNSFLYLKVKKNSKQLEYGSKVRIVGNFEEPVVATNYKGFNYKEYLKTLKVYGSINSKSIEILNSDGLSFELQVVKISNQAFLKIKNIIQSSFNPKIASVLLGVTLGYTDEIEEDLRLNFSESNMSHLLAVSGLHVGFLILGIKIIFEKLIGKRKNRIVTAVFLIVYMFITGFSPSVVRACIVAELALGSYIFYRRNDIWQNLSLAMLILLLYNPFLIKSIGVQLTFLGTIRDNY